MRRRALAVALLLAVAVAVYELALRDSSADPHLRLPQPAATIGSGPYAIGVSANGAILAWLPAPKEGSLPRLPVSTPPEGSRLRGTLLEQARVLGAAPPILRPCIDSSYYGESGVDVRLRSGIELRFGDASRAAEKWRAAATVLADPSVTALDYVDLYAPGHPALGGSGHTLPPPSQSPTASCGE
ncbi:MAG: cell division protein FtsQ/DivIB [Solirubrobacterales bacterium]